jgi:hypothetical protein
MLVHLGLSDRPDKSELALGESPGSMIVLSRDEFLYGLRRSAQDGAYLAVHGEGLGLEQQVLFADGSRLSASTALDQSWPPWVIFASCLVGRVMPAPGDEPLGLPISCLLGGASTVIGGVIDVFNGTAGSLAAEVAQRLLAGEHPARALRAAQLAKLRRRTPPAPYAWAGFACMSLIPPV